MSGPAKLLMLLSTPFSLLYSRPSGFRLARYSRVSIGRLSATVNSNRFCLKPRPRSCFSIKASEEIHTQTSSVREDYGGESLGFSLNNRVLHPWPEWSNLVDNLRAGGYFDHQSSSCVAFEVELPGYGNIPEEFIVAANACLSFARSRLNLLRSLSRKDMQVVVENGSPFLFKDALDSARRMRSFLEGSGNNGIESGKGDMVDLMQFLLSNACDPYVASDRKNHSNKELVESSVRNLLSQLADASRTDQGLELSASKPNQFTNGYGQTTRPAGPNIVMKRGDWICQKCNFMNFSRNLKCLECSESRPKRQLTGGEWECPQCDFFNYGKNSSCIRCDCMRPGEAQYGTTMPRTLLDYSNGSKLNKIRTESGLGENDEKADERFSKSSQVEGRGEVSQSKPLDASISQSLDRILGRSSASSQTGSHFSATRENTGEERSSFSSQAATRYRQSERNNSGNVPFVPLAADMFAKSQKSEIRNEQVEGNHDSVTSNISDQTGYFSGNADSGKSSDGFQLTEKPVNQTEDQEDREMAEKSDRWFKKVAELHDVTDLSSAISDEDFPEIMPMRKGENRFVVSKKKDRSLTSPLYKRRMAMEQSSNTNFVPFVPFPPDYFAKKEKQPEGEVSKERAVRETSSAAEPTKDILNALGKSSEDAFADLGASGSSVRPLENQHPGSENWNTSKGGNGYSESNSSYGVLSKASSAQQPENLEISGRSSRRGSVDGADYGASTLASSVSETGNRGVWNTGSSGKGRAGSPTTGTTISRSDNLQANERESRNNGSSWKGSAGDPSPQPPDLPNERESWNKGFSGKSLEGSAVKEPDPLDMSQEAKEQRWFRRVAQIKDISELSNIPDEDFPEIMPMRKGVNRFVVSKRKTPLERRLTSPQYRRNLPIVSSDPVKKNDDIS